MTLNQKPIGILYNPIASSGLSYRLANDTADACSREGLSYTLQASEAKYEPGKLEGFLESISRLIVIGGDGTIRSLSLSCALVGIPIALIPAGNESLLAHRLGHHSVEHALALIKHGVSQPWHFFLVNGRHPFLLMLSMGFDSWLINYIGHRKGRLSNWHYVQAAVATFFNPNPVISIQINEQIIKMKQRAYCILANDRAYPKLALTPSANGWDSSLHLGILPGRGIWQRTKWATYFFAQALGYSQKHGLVPGSRSLVLDDTSSLTLMQHNQPVPVQLDGDLMPSATLNDFSRLEVTSSPQPLIFLKNPSSTIIP